MTKQRQDWMKYHKNNPGVYELFKKFTFELIDRGFKHSSHWNVMNRVRWETTLATFGSEYKIPNGFIAYYARLFMDDYPEYMGFFTTRKMKGEEEDF
jgi:hypothetical protein